MCVVDVLGEPGDAVDGVSDDDRAECYNCAECNDRSECYDRSAREGCCVRAVFDSMIGDQCCWHRDCKLDCMPACL